ncbi:MAG: MarR family transcriptional regulator, partial [Deltaproteobacteria bacterium]|nr:MarR family transcriptional regulator [Deltaproteobacteria bacterium]
EQWMILLLLWQEDGRYPYQLAEIIGKDRAAITRLIDGLEKRNLVVRTPDKSDRRQKQVHLTPQGKAMEEKLVPLGFANIKHAQTGLSSKELAACKAALRKVYGNLCT